MFTENVPTRDNHKLQTLVQDLYNEVMSVHVQVHVMQLARQLSETNPGAEADWLVPE